MLLASILLCNCVSWLASRDWKFKIDFTEAPYVNLKVSLGSLSFSCIPYLFRWQLGQIPAALPLAMGQGSCYRLWQTCCFCMYFNKFVHEILMTGVGCYFLWFLTLTCSGLLYSWSNGLCFTIGRRGDGAIRIETNEHGIFFPHVAALTQQLLNGRKGIKTDQVQFVYRNCFWLSF